MCEGRLCLPLPWHNVPFANTSEKKVNVTSEVMAHISTLTAPQTPEYVYLDIGSNLGTSPLKPALVDSEGSRKSVTICQN